jgi:glycosyltransferase involved in cell wall biosynthesis
MPVTISVVTPSLNQGRYIETTIRSVLAQDYPHYEHIVVDGGSTDETRSILERYGHLRWVSEPDAGQTAAINKGLRMTKGQVVAYLCADDLYRERALAAVAEAFEADPTIAALVGDCDVIDELGRPCGRYRARLDRFTDLLRYWRWGKTFCLPQASVFLRRGVLEEVGWFDETYDLAMDYEMWLRIAARYPWTLIPRTLAAFRASAGTKTSRRRREMDLEQFRASRAYWGRIEGWERWTIPVEASLHAVWASSGR